MSRARLGTTLHADADDLDQARHDPGVHWSIDQHQRWITDTAVPAPQQSTPPTTLDVDGGQATEERRFGAYGRLAALEADLQDLYAGRRRWQHTSEGTNARRLNDLRSRLDIAERDADRPNARRRDLRVARREAGTLKPALEAAEAKWLAVGQPAAENIHVAITGVEAAIERNQVAERRQDLAALLDGGCGVPPPSSTT